MHGSSRRKRTIQTARRRRRRTPIALVALAITVGCAGGPERAVLDQFFAASRLRDFTALEKVSTVIFEPRQDGTVLDYDVVSVTKTGADTEEVVVIATVNLPSGKRERRPLVVALRRVKEQWMVASVKVSTESTSPVSPHR